MHIYIDVIIEKFSLLKVPELTISNLHYNDLCVDLIYFISINSRIVIFKTNFIMSEYFNNVIHAIPLISKTRV